MLVVAGEALMDVFDAGATATGLTLDARIGGSPYNVALGLARLGQPVRFLGAVSTGWMGERLMQAMRDEGIDTASVVRTAKPTSMCMIGLDAQGVPCYDFVGADGADRQLPSHAITAVPSAVQALHIGSYTAVVPPISASLRQLVEQLQGQALISYDPNVRLIVEPQLEVWRDTLAHMVPRTQLLKVSEEDLSLLFPGVPVAELASRWLALGAGWVVVTRGGDGASAWHPTAGLCDTGPVPVKVVDTVGAGDTFQAALLTWLAENGQLSPNGVASMKAEDCGAALRFAARAAAITCSRRGADLPRRAELR